MSNEITTEVLAKAINETKDTVQTNDVDIELRINGEKEKFKNCTCSSFSRNIIIYFWPNVLARNVCYDRWRSKYGIPCGLLTCDTDSFYSNDCYILYRG